MALSFSSTPLPMDSNNADTNANWSGDSGAADPEFFIQGNASISWFLNKNSREVATLTASTPSVWDMSDTDTHIYWWMNSSIAQYIEVKTTGTTTPSGITVRLTDTSANFREWHVTGSDIWDGAWTCFVVDTRNVTELYAQSGTMDWANIVQFDIYADSQNINYRNSDSNIWIDAPRYGTGLTVVGTTTASSAFSEISALDESNTNRYGILQNIEGTIFCQGRITIGDGTTTTTFTSNNEDLKFRSDFPSGGFISSTLYTLTADVATISMQNGSIKAAGTTDVGRFVFDATGSSNYTLSGMAISRASDITFGSGCTVENTTFNNCFEIIPGISTFSANTITNSAEPTGGSLYLPLTNNISNPTFLNYTTPVAAVRIDTTGTYAFSGYTFDGSGIGILNESTGLVTINSTGSTGLGTTSFTNTNGGTTSIENQVTYTVTNIEDQSEVRIFDATNPSNLVELGGVETVGTTPTGVNNVSVTQDSETSKFNVTYSYNYNGDVSIYVVVHNLNYQWLRAGDTLESTNTSLQIAQIPDRQYF